MTTDDGFFEDLNSVVPSEGRTKLDRILDDPNLSEKFRKELLAALLTPRFSAKLISDKLRSRTINVGETAIKNYRRDLWTLVLAQVDSGESDDE